MRNQLSCCNDCQCGETPQLLTKRHLEEVTKSKSVVKSLLENTGICVNLKQRSDQTEINPVKELLRKMP